MSAVAAGAQPRRLGSFEILREIGQGGMGVVYLARQPALERFVVLKKIRRELLVDPTMVERFQREARAAAAVHHQNVVGVYDCFESRGDHYIAQEFVEGRDLCSVLAEVGRLDPEVAALIALEVARGLEEIHARGIVHRDLKPANILVGSTGETKIADFGIAVEGKADGLTRPGILVGSIPYMAPEQLLGQRADHRTDVFLFGNLLFEMLAGAPAYRGPADEPLESLLERMQRERYPSLREIAPGTPRLLSRMVRSCLRPRPAQRTPSSALLRQTLERALGRPTTHECRGEIARYLWDHGVFASAEGRTVKRRAPARSARIAGRRRLRWALSAAAVLILVVAASAGRALLFGGDEERIDRAPALAPAPARHEVAPLVERLAAVPAAAVVEPAHVRFVADPWAEIRVDDAPGFVTPRAAPLELVAGTHRVVFAHPTFGRVEMLVELAPGENRTLRHDFEKAAPR